MLSLTRMCRRRFWFNKQNETNNSDGNNTNQKRNNE